MLHPSEPHSTLDPRQASPNEFIAKASSVGIAESHARKILGAVVGKGVCDLKDWIETQAIPRKFGALLPQLERLVLERTEKSQVDSFQKAVFRTKDGLAVESVIIPLQKIDKATLCLSSQVGCVMGCVFCATAKLAKRRNLKTWEIVDQYIQCRKIAHDAGLQVSGVVFMGMGEPFLNYENVISAAKLFSFPTANPISGRAITISTVGLVDKIDLFTNENHPFRLSISLGAATDEKRARLVPVAAKAKVSDVMAAARRYATSRNDRVNLSYVCIRNENVFEEDAKALGELIGDTPVRLDLIEVRDSEGKFLPPTSEEMTTFRDALRHYVRQPVARRYSGGADINAACGTLAAV